MAKQYFVTGIGTDVGKTIISAILIEALGADYWKPVQCGALENSDTMRVQELVSARQTKFYQETYALQAALSPHAAAKLEQLEIELEKFILPTSERNLIVEGAGGLMVPLNDTKLVIDLIQHLKIPVLLVSNIYLGSINHTLLSIEALQRRNIPLAGIIFNGNSNPESERIILKMSGVKLLGHIHFEQEWNKQTIKKYAEQLKDAF